MEDCIFKLGNINVYGKLRLSNL